MPPITKHIELTYSEVNHLITLIEDSEEDGAYYGNKEQYWKRSARIKQKLISIITTI